MKPVGATCKFCRSVQTILTMVLVATLSDFTLADSDEWRSRNDRGNRYEGLIEIPAGNPDVRILGFTILAERNVSKKATVTVNYFVPIPRSITVLARDLSGEYFYFMQSKPSAGSPGWRSFGPWETRVVIDREEILFSDLGIVVMMDDLTGDVYLPTYLATDKLKEAGAYQIYVTSRLSLVNLMYSVITEDGEEVFSSAVQPGIRHTSGEAIPLLLNFTTLPEGKLSLILSASAVTKPDELLSWSFRFFHKTAPIEND